MMLHVLHTFRVSEPQPQPGCSRIFLSDWNVSFVFLPGPEEFQVTVTWLMSRHAFALPILFSKLANVSTSNSQRTSIKWGWLRVCWRIHASNIWPPANKPEILPQSFDKKVCKLWDTSCGELLCLSCDFFYDQNFSQFDLSV